MRLIFGVAVLLVSSVGFAGQGGGVIIPHTLLKLPGRAAKLVERAPSRVAKKFWHGGKQVSLVKVNAKGSFNRTFSVSGNGDRITETVTAFRNADRSARSKMFSIDLKSGLRVKRIQ